MPPNNQIDTQDVSNNQTIPENSNLPNHSTNSNTANNVNNSVNSNSNRESLTPADKKAFKYEKIGLFFTVLSLLFVGWQLQEQVKSTKLQTEAIQLQIEANKAQYISLDRSIYQDLMSKSLDLSKELFDAPEIYEYLFLKPLAKEKIPKEILPKLYAAVDYHLDYFQLIYSQRAMIQGLEDGTSDWDTWKNYMQNTFTKSSPLFCEQFIQDKDMYGDNFKEDVVKNQWCPKLKLSPQR